MRLILQDTSNYRITGRGGGVWRGTLGKYSRGARCGASLLVVVESALLLVGADIDLSAAVHARVAGEVLNTHD